MTHPLRIANSTHALRGLSAIAELLVSICACCCRLEMWEITNDGICRRRAAAHLMKWDDSMLLSVFEWWTFRYDLCQNTWCLSPTLLSMSAVYWLAYHLIVFTGPLMTIQRLVSEFRRAWSLYMLDCRLCASDTVSCWRYYVFGLSARHSVCASVCMSKYLWAR